MFGFVFHCLVFLDTILDMFVASFIKGKPEDCAGQKAEGSPGDNSNDRSKWPHAGCTDGEQISSGQQHLRAPFDSRVPPARAKPRKKKPSGAIPKVRHSQPREDVGQLTDETAECTKMLTVGSLNEENDNHTHQLTNAISVCHDYPSWSLPPLNSNLQNCDTGCGNQGGPKDCCEIVTLSVPALHDIDFIPDKSRETTSFNSSSDESCEVETGSCNVPPRPPTPEEGYQATHNASPTLVTGHSSCNTSGCLPVVSYRGSNKNLNSQQRGNPCENDDGVRTDGLIYELTQENKILLVNEKYLVQDLRVKSEECVQLCAEKNELKLQLEESRAECATLQQENEELRQEGIVMLADNIEMIRQLEELLHRTMEERDRLRERLEYLHAHPMPPILEEED